MGVSAAVVALAVAASPWVSAPILFRTGAPGPTAVTSPTAAAWDGSSFQLVVSVPPETYPSGEIQLNRLSPSGVLLDATGVFVETQGPDAVAVACHGAACIVSQSIVAVGVVQSRPTGVPFALHDIGAGSRVEWDGAHYVQLWTDSFLNLLFSRFEADGGALDGPAGVQLGSTVFYFDRTGLACVAGGQCLAAWERDVAGASDILAVRFATSTGNVLDTTPLAIATTADDELVPSVASDGTQYLVTWMQRHVDGGMPLARGRRVTAQGTLLDGAGLTLGSRENVEDDQGPCAAFDGTQFWAGWAVPGGVVVATRVSAAGVVDPAPLNVGAVPGTIARQLRCASAPGLALVTWGAALPSTEQTTWGAVVSSDSGTVGPVALAIDAPRQVAPSLAGHDGGFKLVWTEQLPGRSVLHGIELGPSGFSGIADVVPQGAAPRQASVSCDGASCLIAWLEASNGSVVDSVSASVLPPGTMTIAAPTVVVSSDAGVYPSQVVAVHGSSTWAVVLGGLGVRGRLLTPDGQTAGPLVQIPVVGGTTGFDTLLLAATRGPDHAWLAVGYDDGINTYQAFEALPADQLAVYDGARRIRPLINGPGAFDYGSSGPIEIHELTDDAGYGAHALAMTDAGTVGRTTLLGIELAEALAFDGVGQLCVGGDSDGGTMRLLAQELTGDGAPTAAPFEIDRETDKARLPARVTAIAPGAYALAWSEMDHSMGVGAYRLVLVLVSLSGKPVGAGCAGPAECQTFMCSAGQCQQAPDAGLLIGGEDAGPSDGGSFSSDSGFPPDGGGIVLPDGGVLLPDGGSGLQAHPLGVGCGCSTPAPGALGLLLGLLAARRRRRVSAV